MSTKKTDLLKYRDEIDSLDKKLLDILSKRFSVTKKVGQYKAKNNLPIKDLKREKEMFVRRVALAKKYSLEKEMISKIFRAIIDSVYKEHKKLRKK
ncbi:MAG: chorismate mutase [Parcubacteria group bacterium]|jgi:chorismate mutase